MMNWSAQSAPRRSARLERSRQNLRVRALCHSCWRSARCPLVHGLWPTDRPRHRQRCIAPEPPNRLRQLLTEERTKLLPATGARSCSTAFSVRPTRKRNPRWCAQRSPRGLPSFPQLSAALKDDRTAEYAAQSLAYIGGEEALPVLVEAAFRSPRPQFAPLHLWRARRIRIPPSHRNALRRDRQIGQ